MPAIPLIELLPSGQFRINPDAAAYLVGVSSPLAIVACAGMYRTGKSSLLNRVLLDVKGDDGFGVGQTVQACTKGLWMHTDILRISRDKDSGTVTNVLIIDTEGLGAFNATSSHDSRIFSLALLLSSYFIYNSVGTIDEQAISTLSLVANISKLVKTKSDADVAEEEKSKKKNNSTDDGGDALADKVASAAELGKLFPDFLWVVRDFSLQLRSEEGDVLSPDQYLEQALRDKTADGSDVSAEQASALAEKNHLRSLLRAYFPRRQCVTMVRPCANEADLQRIDTMPKEEMRPEFWETAKKVRTTILRNAPAKTVADGKLLSGRGLVHLCETYVNAMNSGVAPVIRDSWALLTEVQFRDAIEAAEEHFLALLEQKTGDGAHDPVQMEKMLSDAEREALHLFASEAPDRTGPMYKQFADNLSGLLSRLAEEARQANLKCLDDCARELLETHVDNRQFDTWQAFVDTALGVASEQFFGTVGMSSHAKAAWARLALPRVQNVAQTFGDRFDAVRGESDRYRESALKAEEWKKQVATLEGELRDAQTKIVEIEAEAQAEKEALLQQLSRTSCEMDAIKAESREASSVGEEEWNRREQLLREETQASVAEAEAVAKQASIELERIKENSEEARAEFQQRFETLQRNTDKSIREMREANEREIEALQSAADDYLLRAEDAEAKLEASETTVLRTKRKYDDTVRRFEECETKLADERSKNEQALQDLHEKWRQETRTLHDEKLELTRAAKVAEAKLAIQERELASLREKLQEERPNVEAERAIAALERVEAESQRIRTELFEVRRTLEEERANLRKLERQLRDQQREHELAQHNLKMNYEVQAAQERAQAAVSRRSATTSATSTGAATQSKRAKLF